MVMRRMQWVQPGKNASGSLTFKENVLHIFHDTWLLALRGHTQGP
jgi:hypothetical protein